MKSLNYDAENLGHTDLLGEALAAVLPPGTTVALEGTLGAGKTHLVQAIAAASGVERQSVVSPTFVLVQQYHGQRPICHVDAYRIADVDEFEQLGSDEFLFEHQGLALVEWADRVADALPPERLTVRIEVTGPTRRRFVVEAAGAELEAALARLQEYLTERAARR
jgi:tRNA threonylcarbamoyladenosine biosynthesis protein TsaE